MTRRPLVYGIDFGTTNSVLAAGFSDGTVEIMPGLREPVLRSAVFRNREGTTTAGSHAIQQFLTRPDMTAARLFLEVKASLTDDLDSVTLFGNAVPVEELVASVMRYLKLCADRATGHDVRRAVVGFPVAFPGADGHDFDQLQDRALTRLEAAANLAGFQQVSVLEEPAAASSAEDAELYVALDFGGGTFDVAVVRNAEYPEVLGLSGVDVGGELLTSRLFVHHVAPELGLHHPRLPNAVRHHTSSLGRVLAALFAGRLETAGLPMYAPRFHELVRGGFLHDLYEAVDAAKVALSTRDHASVRLVRSGVDIDIPVRRSDFEALIAKDIARLADEIRRALQQADVTPSQVQLATLTGGSSRIPAFRSMVASVLPAAALQERDPYSLVARGLAREGLAVAW